MVEVLVLVALILALVDEFIARGRSLVGWAVVFLAVAVLIADTGFHL